MPAPPATPDRWMNAGPAARAAWLGVALGVSAATQLHLIPGTPVRPELVPLALWMAAAAFRLVRRPRVPPFVRARGLVAFWGAGAVLLALGGAVAAARGLVPADGSARHDTLAYLFTGTLVALVAADEEDAAWLPRAYLWMVPTLVIPAMLMLLWGAPAELGPVVIHGWVRRRFVGLTTNTNQLALALLLLPFLGIGLSRTHPRPAVRVLVRMSTAVGVALALATRSDAMFASWLLGGSVAAGGAAALRGGRMEPPRRRRVLVRGGLVLAIVLAAAGPYLAGQAQAYARAVYAQEGQGPTRLALWTHGVQAWAAAPLTGLGPGKHSGYRGPFGAEEAHNTLIDWASATGVAGALALVALLAWSARRVWAARRPALLGGLAALACFSMFHHVLRQPAFWMGLATLVALAGTRPAAAEDVARGAEPG